MIFFKIIIINIVLKSNAQKTKRALCEKNVYNVLSRKVGKNLRLQEECISMLQIPNVGQ